MLRRMGENYRAEPDQRLRPPGLNRRIKLSYCRKA
jgi:hypothetical protein